ncbi:hypothetical protein SAMN05660473_00477 [Arthrobacter sp. 49Tsu3.1M3]|uniref:hypothetical protein n=1 Tax=Arthrobacter sp. 49Tsu3.1M3 TaxID=1279029 RepID=UPI0009A71894|nr:hypothetical protein [Arthrobacter sp. 49Tsu3.1M3]SKB38915.1 hypothetical protein SAMN05660473_00477 [Arthrobacter sp. 49Tsu3.1M3]
MRGPSIAARAAWAGIAAAGLILLCLGLGQTFYFGSVTNAFARDQIGNTLILAGAVLDLAAAGWSRHRGDPLWVTVTVAVPAVVIGGLNLVVGDSLLPHIAALAAVPLGVVGVIGGVVGQRRRTPS